MKAGTQLIGKRESLKIQVRERLLEESLKLFSVQGLEKTTVADIVEQSGIARGTFYNYFADDIQKVERLLNKDLTIWKY